MTSLFIWEASYVGTEAGRLLAASGFSGRVLAALPTVVYLSGSGGEILWLARQGLPMHRRCLLSSFQPSFFRAGQNFFVKDSCLCLGKDTIIDLSQAIEWKPSPIGPGQRKGLAIVDQCVHKLVEAILMSRSAEGLGELIPMISAVSENKAPQGSPRDPLIARGLSSILGVAEGCLRQDIFRITERGKELIGLGPGLTPSGDDFLGGLLFMTHSLKTAYPEYFYWEEQPIKDLIESACTKTHPISHTILRDLCLGHGPETLHDLVACLLNGEGRERVTTSFNQLIRIGHQTGWDLLAGVLTGTLLVSGKLRRSRCQAVS